MSHSLAVLEDVLSRVGYGPGLVELGPPEPGLQTPGWLAGYVRLPRIARHACVAAVAAGGEHSVGEVIELTGAPVGLVLEDEVVRVWGAGPGGPRLIEVLPLTDFDRLTERARSLIDPLSIHRAKTAGRFDGRYQLEFVDVGLLAQIEQAQGRHLRRLLELIIADLRRGVDALTPEQGHQLLTIAFWVLAARMLRDHCVPAFVTLPAEGREILAAVARHYSGAVPLLAYEPGWTKRIDDAARRAWRYAIDLGRVGPEAIGYVYESALIAKKTRKDLGTHSTPPYLVEYVVGRLRDRILDLAPDRRKIVEPAAGHGAFLVAGLRVLAEDVPVGEDRHTYLRACLSGIEFDHAAKEMARLSLTIADVPNPDGWNLKEGDLFAPRVLEDSTRGATVLLANPPFEDFGPEHREQLRTLGSEPALVNKTAELLRRALPTLEPDALIGVVVPREFLHDRGARSVRRMLLDSFQLLEICVFPDKVFQFSDHECAVILASGCQGGTSRTSPVRFRRVREAGMGAFRASFAASSEEILPGAFFLDRADSDLAVPELRRLWVARAWRTLGEIAIVQQGLSYFGWVRASGHETVRERPFDGAVLGVAAPGRSKNLLITEPPHYCYMDVANKHVMRTRGGLSTGQPQVVLNTHPHGRGPWRLMACIDPKGAATPSTRVVVRPRDSSTSVELLWALCNSPMANAYAYSHLGKRDITTGQLEQLPVPSVSAETEAQIVRYVQSLFEACIQREYSRARELLDRIDALVLGCYGLFAPEEQALLRLFEGQQRPGLPFPSSPAGMSSRLPQYFRHPDLCPDLSAATRIGPTELSEDVESIIDDGHKELAELRRREGGADLRVETRIRVVREAIQRFAQHVADTWIPDAEPARATEDQSP